MDSSPGKASPLAKMTGSSIERMNLLKSDCRTKEETDYYARRTTGALMKKGLISGKWLTHLRDTACL
jgi:hypothetical protein